MSLCVRRVFRYSIPLLRHPLRPSASMRFFADEPDPVPTERETELRNLGFNTEQIAKLNRAKAKPSQYRKLGLAKTHAALAKSPGLTELSFERNSNLLRDFGLNNVTIGRILHRFPESFRHAQLDVQLYGAFDALNVFFAFSKEEFINIMRKDPRGVMVKPAAVEERIHFFLNEFKLEPSQLRRMILAYPVLLALRTENLKARADYFQAKVILFLINQGFAPEQFSRMIRSMPALFGYSLEHFDCQFAYMEALGIRRETLIRAATSSPMLLTFSAPHYDRLFEAFEQIGLTRAEAIAYCSRVPTALRFSSKKIVNTLRDKVGEIRARAAKRARTRKASKSNKV